MAIAYENGSSSDYIDFVAKLRTFLAANGWTVSTAGNSAWGAAASFVASRGLCHLYFGTDDYSETNYYVTTTRQTVTLRRFVMGLGDSAPGTPASVLMAADMPGYLDTTASNYTAKINHGQTEGQYTNYYFFDDPVANTFTAVLEALGERYWHFGFGELAKNGMTHSGVPYITASRNIDYFLTTGVRAKGNNPFQQEFFGGGGLWNEGSTYYGGGGNTQINVPSDALPVGTGYPEGTGGRIILHKGEIVGIINAKNHHSTYRSPWGQQSRMTVGTATEVSGVLPVGGMTPLGAFPIFVGSSGTRMCYLGDIPNARVCNIEHLSPGTELSYGAETWKLFPRFVKTDDDLIDDSFVLTSGALGIAIRKA